MAAEPRMSFIRDLEEELLRSEVRANRMRVSELLSDDFVEFGESGKVYRKQDVLDHLQNTTGVTYTILDFATSGMSPGVLLTTYLAQKEEGGSGRMSRSLRSSLWRNLGGKWQIVFHQGTPLREAQGATGSGNLSRSSPVEGTEEHNTFP